MLYVQFYKVFLQCKWALQFLIVQSHKKYKIEKYNLDAEKILIIVPHADDELIGCYQFMKSTNAKVRLFYCNMTGSNTDVNNKDIRKNEFKELCHKNGFEYSVSDEIIEQSLNKAIREYNPDAIFLPSIVDWHPQHREVNDITRTILYNTGKKPKMIWYQVTVPIDYKWVNYYVPMNKHQQNEKWEMFSHAYKSQNSMPLMRLKYNERIAGGYFSEYAAEVFCVMSFGDWENYMCIYTEVSLGRLMTLKCSINDLRRVRKEAAYIYRRMSLGMEDY